jgi:DNA-binding NarL/FixJ family response regulator
VTHRVLLVDDQQLVRAGFRMILADEDDMEVVGEAANGREAVERATELAPHVVVMDIRMPVMDGVEATRNIVAEAGDRGPRILVLTTFDADDHVVEALRAGASGFLLKDVTPPDFVNAIRIVAAGEALIAPSVTRRLLDRFAHLPTGAAGPDPRLAGITEREREVLVLVAQGLANHEIAERLTLAEPTVKSHVSHLLLKLDVRDRAQLVILAYETGLITPGAGAFAARDT